MKIRLLQAGDWEGIYIDDKLIAEDHSVDAITILLKLFPDADYDFTDIDEGDGSGSGLERWNYDCPKEWLDEFEEKGYYKNGGR